MQKFEYKVVLLSSNSHSLGRVQEKCKDIDCRLAKGTFELTYNLYPLVLKEYGEKGYVVDHLKENKSEEPDRIMITFRRLDPDFLEYTKDLFLYAKV